MGCSTPAFPVLHHLLEFVQMHVLWVDDAIQPPHPLSPLSPPTLNLSQHQGLRLKSVWNCQYPQSFSFVFPKASVILQLANLECDSGLGRLGAGRSRSESLLSDGWRRMGWLSMPVLFPWLSNQVRDPSSLEKNKREDKQSECLGKNFSHGNQCKCY